ncbi:MAG TPA: ScpA family protein [Microlunatus sp.]|nr:ScpA family protein [Microlunatus sp.]
MVPDGPVTETGGVFQVHLTNFTGPFDLLLQLISKHKLDVTEVALSVVTDEFIAHIKAAGDAWDLDQTSQFIVVAATLLDLKAARLLPSGEMTDSEDLALLEARDLLFARLLQYKAYKQIAAFLVHRLTTEDRRHPRQVGPDPRFASLLPEIRLTITPEELAALAAKAMAPKQADVISLVHLHASTVSVREQAALVIDRLRRAGTLTFRALTADAGDRVTTVARFLALLELFREQAVVFEQLTPLGELTIRWTGSESGELDISDEFDEGTESSASVVAPATTDADNSAER